LIHEKAPINARMAPMSPATAVAAAIEPMNGGRYSLTGPLISGAAACLANPSDFAAASKPSGHGPANGATKTTNPNEMSSP